MSDQPPGQDVLRERLLEIAHRAEMGFTERFEHDAERFYRETGLMAPGKSVPMEMWSDDMDRRRGSAWDDFQGKLKAEFIESMREAAAALSGASSPGSGWQPICACGEVLTVCVFCAGANYPNE